MVRAIAAGEMWPLVRMTSDTMARRCGVMRKPLLRSRSSTSVYSVGATAMRAIVAVCCRCNFWRSARLVSLGAMTVMVTGASGVVGHAVVGALLARDEVRATVRHPTAAEPLRALGAKVAVLDPHRVDELAEVLPRCHTLVHLIGGVRQPDAEALFWANHGSVEVTLEAAQQIGTKRFVLLSVPGANPE